jgi:trimeric autotransporter adhesin
MLGATGANTGSYNCAFGSFALAGLNAGNDNPSYNTAIGASALDDCYAGSYNVAVGCQALQSVLSTSFIVAVGDSALQQNGRTTPTGDSASENTAIGSASMSRNIMGAYNTATGFQTLHQNLTGYHNTANGASALWNNTGSYNTASGSQSLIANTSGSNNSAFGYLALSQNTTGSNNAAFGDNTGPTSASLGNTTCLGSGAQASASNSVVLGNLNVTTLYCQGAYAATTANSANMVVNANGQIMRSTSSARYKTNIHDLDINTDRLYDLRPVSYTSKIDGKEYFGLVAEDVAKVLPDLAEYARSKDVIPGSTSDEMIPDAVKYPMLSVLLLDELKKEHARAETEEKQMETQEKKIETQAKIIADMERRLEALEDVQKGAR